MNAELTPDEKSAYATLARAAAKLVRAQAKARSGTATYEAALLCPDTGETICSHQTPVGGFCNSAATVLWSPAQCVSLRFCSYHWARLVNSDFGSRNRLPTIAQVRDTDDDCERAAPALAAEGEYEQKYQDWLRARHLADDHGCLTGDCRHEDKDDCAIALRVDFRESTL